jgi:hypothetical protein
MLRKIFIFSECFLSLYRTCIKFESIIRYIKCMLLIF